MARLFFALWPDAACAEALGRVAADLVRRCGGREVPGEKIHLTLAFLGEVGPGRLDATREAGAEPRAAAFTLALDTVGSFRGARVAWAGAARPDGSLLALAYQLRRALLARGFELEERGFTPHVTLVRRIERGMREATIAPIAWRARSLALVRSETDSGRYTTIGEWPLEGG